MKPDRPWLVTVDCCGPSQVAAPVPVLCGLYTCVNDLPGTHLSLSRQDRG